MRAGFIGCIARYIPLTLPMPDQPQPLGPILTHRLNLPASLKA
jgi:hypothetical protein